MIEFAGYALLRPWWLLAVPVAVALAFVAVRRAGGVGDWRRAVDAHLLDAMARRGVVVSGRGRGGVMAALAAGAIALALAGPAVERSEADTFRNLDSVVIAIDLSRSVADSLQFPQARIAALSAAEAAGTRQVGLVVFAGDAYVASPPTSDRKGLETTLSSLDGDTTPDAGSAPGRALALAARVLKDGGTVGGDIVLISDGGGVDEGAQGDARAIAAEGHALSTLYVAPAEGAARQGLRQAGRPELDALATLGGGAAASVETPDAVMTQLGKAAAERLGKGSYASLMWNDLGRWMLVVAAFPVLLLFRRRA